jgi:hypothetical protein
MTLSSNICNGRHDINLSCSWVFPRVRRVQAINVREEEEVIGMDHRRRDRRKRVVVTKFYFLCHQAQLAYQRNKKHRRTLTEIVSFSFTIGTTPILKSSLIVFTAFKYRVRCQKRVSVAKTTRKNAGDVRTSEISPRVSKICAVR